MMRWRGSAWHDEAVSTGLAEAMTAAQMAARRARRQRLRRRGARAESAPMSMSFSVSPDRS